MMIEHTIFARSNTDQIHNSARSKSVFIMLQYYGKGLMKIKIFELWIPQHVSYKEEFTTLVKTFKYVLLLYRIVSD